MRVDEERVTLSKKQLLLIAALAALPTFAINTYLPVRTSNNFILNQNYFANEPALFCK